jgi:hypothetical protein
MLLIVGAGASTLDAVTTEGAGALLVAATGAATLGATTTSGAGRVSIAASGAATLDAVTTEALPCYPSARAAMSPRMILSARQAASWQSSARRR